MNGQLRGSGGRGRGRTLLVFSQTFVPDPASVGQHVADVAIEMARRGHRVVVYASNRGYDDPTRVYAPRENLYGADVRRLPLSSFGKKSILTRGMGTASFLAQCLFIGLSTRNLGGILFSTSPPMVGVIHPCKVYGAMTVGRPILFLGPRPSHIADLLKRYDFGLQVSHGDVDGAVRAIRTLREMSPMRRLEMGKLAQEVLAGSLSQSILCKAFCDALEQKLELSPHNPPCDTPSVGVRESGVVAA